MKRYIILLSILMLSPKVLWAQDFGMSFSFFFPKNGYFSTPISPFSIRGLGVDINRYVALETGFSLYRMSGLNMKDLPFESKEPLLGPNFTIFIPAELVLQLPAGNLQLDIKGGGFLFYGMGNKLNYGNIDRAIRAYEAWDVANATLAFENNPGFGYHLGSELTVYVTSQLGISLEVNYLIGQANFPLSGSYSGGVNSGAGSSTIETVSVDDSFSEAKVDFTGLEVSIGLIFSSGSSNTTPKRKKKRR